MPTCGELHRLAELHPQQVSLQRAHGRTAAVTLHPAPGTDWCERSGGRADESGDANAS
jgi:hypothetical protein